MSTSPLPPSPPPPRRPTSAKKPHVVKAPLGAERNDEYYWLRDDKRENPEMLAYLNAENAYADAVMAPLKPLQDTLYDEIVGRIKQDDAACRTASAATGTTRASRPARTTRSMRAAGRPGRRATIGNAPATSQRAGAAGRQRAGRGQGLLQRRRLRGQPGQPPAGLGRRHHRPPPVHAPLQEPRRPARPIPDTITGASPNLVWADDNRTLFYVENDPETLLTMRVKKHVLGTPAAQDDAGLRGEGRQLLHGHRPHPRRQVHLHRRGQHGVRRDALRAGRRSAACSPCWRRASATSNTAPTTSAAAG